MLGEGMKRNVIDTVRRHLLTPKGLRTLSPRNPLYEGRCVGDQPTRDRAYHQGNRMAVAAGTLRESLLRHAREGISPRSKGHAEEF